MYGNHSTVIVCDWNPHCHYISATVTNTSMYGSHSTVIVCDWNPHCHYISTQLPICTVATVQLLYAIGIPTVTISVHSYQYVR